MTQGFEWFEFRYRTVAAAAAFTGLVFLGGCQQFAALTGGTEKFDGVWSGRLQFTSGERDCLRRGGIRAEISFGGVGGTVAWKELGRRSSIGGVVREDGEFQGEVTKGANDYAELKGIFTGRNAEGTWKSSKCKGAWSMRKIRNKS